MKIEDVYRRQGYRLLGKHQHSAVKICRWTKESLRASRVCYKEQWYPPVQSHRCMEMTPYTGCNCHCLYCWRLHSGDRPRTYRKGINSVREEFDEPRDIIDSAIAERKLLLSGWKGHPTIDMEKYEESLNPAMMTMSLTGEPTLYPRISELILEARRKNMITFVVTNGTVPSALREMDTLPYQLYVSVSAPNECSYKGIVRPLFKDGWQKLNQTLELLPSLSTRKVLRLTMIDGWNMKDLEGYNKIVDRAKPNFIEVKAYEWVGQSQNRLPKKAMPYMNDIEVFASNLASLSGYEMKAKFKPSGAVLLA